MTGKATLIALHELIDSDNEKPGSEETRKRVNRRSERGYFNNIIRELRIRLVLEKCSEWMLRILNSYWFKFLI